MEVGGNHFLSTDLRGARRDTTNGVQVYGARTAVSPHEKSPRNGRIDCTYERKSAEHKRTKRTFFDLTLLSLERGSAAQTRHIRFVDHRTVARAAFPRQLHLFSKKRLHPAPGSSQLPYFDSTFFIPHSLTLCSSLTRCLCHSLRLLSIFDRFFSPWVYVKPSLSDRHLK